MLPWYAYSCSRKAADSLQNAVMRRHSISSYAALPIQDSHSLPIQRSHSLSRGLSESRRPSLNDLREGVEYSVEGISTEVLLVTARENHDTHEEQLTSLQRRESKLLDFLEDIDHTFRSKKAPILDEIQSNRLEQQKLIIAASQWSHETLTQPDMDWLYWVDSLWFSVVCTGIICINGAMMIMEYSDKNAGDALGYHVADNVFLAWYTIEIVLKACLYRKALLFGEVAQVWWNWLDLIIVATGALEQWMVPAILWLAGGHGTSSLSPLKMLRFLRLFRICRLLKVLKVFASYDMHWVEEQSFQSFMICIIAVNALTMGLELDIDWKGWVVVEEVFLVIYCFEILARLTHSRLKFFYNESWKWNNLDFIIVASGVAEMWLSPFVELIQSLITGKPAKPIQGSFADFMKLFRLMRLLRVLRLVRLLRSIPPLFKLVSGIVEAAQGVQYVLLLAFVLLYAAAIIFTTLIGKGLLWEGPAPAAARESFGSVVTSLFMLFKLMNDDQSVVEGVIDSPFVKLLFAIFMVISNWMVLAVLTSVVSDGMVLNTQIHVQEERQQEFLSSRARSCRRLKNLFKEVQKQSGEDSSSYRIKEDQFEAMLADGSALSEFRDAAGGVCRAELHELFILSCDKDASGCRVIDYLDFIDKLLNMDNGVIEKSIFGLESRLRNVERTLEEVKSIVKKSSPLSEAELEAAQKQGISRALTNCDLRDLSHDHVRRELMEDDVNARHKLMKRPNR